MNAATVRDLVVTALKIGETDAQDRIYSPMDWSTVTADYPCIIVQTPFDHKKSLGRAIPQFHTVTTVRITGRLEELDAQDLDGASKAEVKLEALREQIERAVINSYELTRQIQQFLEIRSQISVSAIGEGHLAQLLMDLDIEYYQGMEDFYPIEASSLESINISLQQPDGTPVPYVHIGLT